MNKNTIFPIFIVVLIGLSLWWFIAHTTPKDAMTLSPSISSTVLPSASLSPSPTATQPAITITSPKENELVSSLVTVTGRARVFENQFTVQLKDSTGKVIYEKNAVMTDAQDAGLYGNYSVKIPIPAGTGSTFTIEALSYAPKGDGSFEGYASVIVKLKNTQ